MGSRDADDSEIFKWAQEHDYAIFTHDLDFGTLLAFAKSAGPSVILTRTQDVTPLHLAGILLPAISTHLESLEQGAILLVDELNMRVRLLPLN